MILPLVTTGTTVPLNSFWGSVLLFHNRPNLINKKLAGIVQVYFYQLESTLNDVLTFINHTSMLYEIRRLPQLTKEDLHNFINDLLRPYDKNLTLKEVDIRDFSSVESGIFISLRILIPKPASSKKCVEIVVLNKDKNIATFIATAEDDENSIAPRFPYHLEWTSSGHMRCVVNNYEDADSKSAEWLVHKLFYKIICWAEGDVKINKPQEALQLIPIERYIELYQTLKEKYGKQMVEIWPENTDPLKFVYEDLAIAAYLISIWEIHEDKETNKKQTFVDLGCGNGLLVYILIQEGYDGYGIDVRKRKIWNLYPPNIKLKETAIIPSSSFLFPEADWIIGNHTDELTPWIPVIASRSSYHTNFFLLPCCSYDFTGNKYLRINTGTSVYNEYVEYIESICKICGFVTKQDKMRIPSTKRTCLVSFGRTYPEHEFSSIDNKLTDFIKSRTQLEYTDENWVAGFKPRSAVERVRNCTKLDHGLVNGIIAKVVEKLLTVKAYITGENGRWNAGGSFPLEELVELLTKEELSQLKNNCGGLQTLLKNHRYIFEVGEGDVKLRMPATYENVQKYKEKNCWFFNNHPEGCPHTSYHCAYKHLFLIDSK